MTDTTTIEEVWAPIRGFSLYSVSNWGRILHNKRERLMSVTNTLQGHQKISLLSDEGTRHSRSVALLVAEAFVEPPTHHSDHVILLDGDFDNVAAWNLAWRPRGFAWSYVHQLKIDHPAYYKSLPVRNVSQPAEYSSIIEAGKTEGRLFDDVWRSTWQGNRIFPYGCIFRVIH